MSGMRAVLCEDLVHGLCEASDARLVCFWSIRDSMPVFDILAISSEADRQSDELAVGRWLR